ncbi:exocyst complex subunit 1 [Cavenderia fasciculata]|uniref:Exocyst complex subunit 1 n=1 Tax=Cavenderia fasciculata TaxID=261658 RepID=F4PWY3_CACFS|nr:exocyst complex subunit 1 [Cavenderia fasciculata]EGG19786.1 exocyst complex subunit 1 [Cavenderia fasciculata]|eukprot:XP_004358132.1 exocyst complex subunit 1 [Cavenderia fasciculata]
MSVCMYSIVENETVCKTQSVWFHRMIWSIEIVANVMIVKVAYFLLASIIDLCWEFCHLSLYLHNTYFVHYHCIIVEIDKRDRYREGIIMSSTTTPLNTSNGSLQGSPAVARKQTIATPSSATSSTHSSPSNQRSNILASTASFSDPNNNNNNNNSNVVVEQVVIEDDLEAILQNYLSSETDVDLLTEKLSKQLSTLETEMIVGILESGMGVNEVVSQLGDKDQTHLTGVTAWIDYYNKQLQDMKKYIEHIESKNNKMNIVSNNQKELMKSLEYLLNLLTLDEKTIKCLNTPDFQSADGLANAIKAAGDLKKALLTKLKSGMENMVAVRDQRKLFETFKLSFSIKVSTLIEKEFKITAENHKDFRDSSSVKDDEKLPIHSAFFDSLNRYRPLAHWLKQMDIDKFHPLVPLYVKAYKSSYKHDVKPFFSNVQNSILKESKDQNDFFSTHVKKALETNSKQQLQPTPQTPSKSSHKKRSIDAAFQLCLSCINNAIMSEQRFLMEFFLFSDPPSSGRHQHHHHSRTQSTTSTSTTSTTTNDLKNNNSSIGLQPSKSSPHPISPPISPSSMSLIDDGALGVIENPLDFILSKMFEKVVSNELKDMVVKADQINPFYLLTMLIETERQIATHSVLGPDYSSFIIKILSEVQKTMKTLFNKFIDLQVDSIKSTQSSLKKCGVLSHFKHFPIFVKSLEKYRSTEEMESITSLINSSYYKVVVALNSWMDQLVEKSPDEKYKFIARTENYYYLSSRMGEIGISCLKPYYEQSDNRYRDNLLIYTDFLIGLKFKPLFDFYQKMDELLLTLPPSDIQFQQSHSKQQYKKIVEKFKTENIEKGFIKALASIYKHITRDSPLILVIWDYLEEVFLAKYHHFLELTQKCYQQSMPVSSDQVKGLIAVAFKKTPTK